MADDSSEAVPVAQKSDATQGETQASLEAASAELHKAAMAAVLQAGRDAEDAVVQSMMSEGLGTRVKK